MDSSPASRNVILRDIIPFLDPSVVSVLMTASSGLNESVLGTEDKNLTAKRRVEAAIDEELPTRKHNWELTYSLLTQPVALRYTNNDIDTYIADKMKAGTINTPQELTFEMSTAASQGNTDVFRVLLRKFRDKIDDDALYGFMLSSLASSRMGILQLPEVADMIGRLNEGEIVDAIQYIADYASLPSIADYFLSVANTDMIEANSADNAIHTVITNGFIGLVRVFLKCGVIDPTGEITDSAETYVAKDIDYDYSWNPIWLAAKHGRKDIVLLFLADSSVQEMEGKTGYDIDAVVERGYVDIVKIMLDSGKFYYNSSNAVTASQLGMIDMLRLLLSYPRISDKFNIHASIRYAVANDHTDIVLLLLSHPRARFSFEEKQQLILAAKYNDNSVVERALRLHE